MCPNCGGTAEIKQHPNYKECYACGWIWCYKDETTELGVTYDC